MARMQRSGSTIGSASGGIKIIRFDSKVKRVKKGDKIGEDIFKEGNRSGSWRCYRSTETGVASHGGSNKGGDRGRNRIETSIGVIIHCLIINKYARYESCILLHT